MQVIERSVIGARTHAIDEPRDVTPVRERKAVLVLDGQTNQALACVRSLGRAGFTVFVASRMRRPLAAWSRYCRDSFQLTDESTGAFAAARAWAGAHGVGVVLPMTERACLLCAADRAAWDAHGITVGCGDTDMLLDAFDKGRTLQLAAAHDVAVPLTAFPRSVTAAVAAADILGYPCVVKPRCSNAFNAGRFQSTASVAYAADRNELEHAFVRGRQGEHWPLLQELVPGKGCGIFALFDHGEPIVWFAHERLRDVNPTGSGSSLRCSVPINESLRAPAERLLRGMNWHGPAMVEFRVDERGRPVLIEVNGRFWGSLQLAIAAGIDFPALWLEVLQGRPPSPPAAYDANVTVRWLWGDIKRVLYIMRGPPTGHRGPYPTRIEGLRELFAVQPPATQLEAWQRSDPWPAVGEWLSGVSQLVTP